MENTRTDAELSAELTAFANDFRAKIEAFKVQISDARERASLAGSLSDGVEQMEQLRKSDLYGRTYDTLRGYETVQETVVELAHSIGSSEAAKHISGSKQTEEVLHKAFGGSHS